MISIRASFKPTIVIASGRPAPSDFGACLGYLAGAIPADCHRMLTVSPGQNRNCPAPEHKRRDIFYCGKEIRMAKVTVKTINAKANAMVKLAQKFDEAVKQFNWAMNLWVMPAEAPKAKKKKAKA
jgi:hypothetical protein